MCFSYMYSFMDLFLVQLASTLEMLHLKFCWVFVRLWAAKTKGGELHLREFRRLAFYLCKIHYKYMCNAQKLEEKVQLL